MKAVVTVELERHGEQHTRCFLADVSEEQAVSQAYAAKPMLS